MAGVSLPGVGVSLTSTGVSLNTNVSLQSTTNGIAASGVNVVAANSFNAASIAIFNAFTTPPTAARKVLINNLVVALMSAGVWSLLDLLYLTAAADSQAATINWVSPSTFPLQAVNAPTFTADKGFTGDGTSSRMNTAFTPSTQGVRFTQDSASIWAWSRTSTTGVHAGNASSNPLAEVQFTGTTTYTYRINDGTNDAATGTTIIGFNGSQRQSATDKRAWHNGAQVGTTAATASTGRPTQAQWICGGATTGFSVAQISCAAWGASLAGTEASFYSAILAYMQGVGAA